MSALVPKNLNKNKVERQSLRHPAPVPFVPLSSEVPGAMDNIKHAIKVRINDKTKERVLVFHGGVPEAYLQYAKICEKLIRKKDLRTTFDEYAKEDSPAEEDIILHDMNKPEPDSPAENMDAASISGRIPKENNGSTIFNKCTRTRSILQKKIGYAQKAQNGVQKKYLLSTSIF